MFSRFSCDLQAGLCLSETECGGGAMAIRQDERGKCPSAHSWPSVSDSGANLLIDKALPCSDPMLCVDALRCKQRDADRPMRLLHLFERVQIGADVTGVLLPDMQVRHRRARVDRLGIAQPAQHVLGRVEQYAADVLAPRNAIERRSDCRACADDAGNTM